MEQLQEACDNPKHQELMVLCEDVTKQVRTKLKEIGADESPKEDFSMAGATAATLVGAITLAFLARVHERGIPASAALTVCGHIKAAVDDAVAATIGGDHDA